MVDRTRLEEALGRLDDGFGLSAGRLVPAEEES
jgi:hypothetical protein